MQNDQPDHSPWYAPRTAEIISRGGEGFANSIGQGLQQLANGLAMGLEKRREETKRINTLAKNAEGMYLSSPELQKKLGLSPDEFKALAATDKTSRVYGAVESQGYERRNAELKQFAAQLAESEQKTAQDAEAMKALSQFQTSYRNATTPMQIPSGTFGVQVSGGKVSPSQAETVGGQPMDERSIFDLGMKSRLNPNQLGDVLKAYGDVAKSDRPAFQMPTGARVTGGTVGPSGPSLQFTTEPNRLGEKPERIFLKDGTPTQKAMYSDGSIVDLPTDRAHALTDAQANALQFSERMAFNNKVLSDLESAGFDATGAGAAAQNWTPNVMTGEKFQSYDAARKNWIAAVLRKESGAAISKSEEKGALEQYFPAFGDAPAVVKQKAELRALAETNMRRAIGGIENQAGAAAPKSANRFDDEAAARKAGAKAGDIIELYDPATASYRKARLK